MTPGQISLIISTGVGGGVAQRPVLGGGVAANSLLRERFLDACVVRKAGKAHGLQRRIEGPDVVGRRVLAALLDAARERGDRPKRRRRTDGSPAARSGAP